MERRGAARDQLDRLVVRAPQAGLVSQLAVHTIGGVIMAGATVALIVPDGDQLVVEAHIRPTDIDQAAIGQKAEIQLQTVDARTLPPFTGKVTALSADVIVQPMTRETYYLARISISDEALPAQGTLACFRHARRGVPRHHRQAHRASISAEPADGSAIPRHARELRPYVATGRHRGSRYQHDRTGGGRDASGNPGFGMASKTVTALPDRDRYRSGRSSSPLAALVTALAAAADRFWIGDMITFFRPQLALAVLLARLCAAIWLRRLDGIRGARRAARGQCAAALHRSASRRRRPPIRRTCASSRPTCCSTIPRPARFGEVIAALSPDIIVTQEAKFDWPTCCEACRTFPIWSARRSRSGTAIWCSAAIRSAPASSPTCRHQAIRSAADTPFASRSTCRTAPSRWSSTPSTRRRRARLCGWKARNRYLDVLAERIAAEPQGHADRACGRLEHAGLVAGLRTHASTVRAGSDRAIRMAAGDREFSPASAASTSARRSTISRCPGASRSPISSPARTSAPITCLWWPISSCPDPRNAACPASAATASSRWRMLDVPRMTEVTQARDAACCSALRRRNARLQPDDLPRQHADRPLPDLVRTAASRSPRRSRRAAVREVRRRGCPAPLSAPANRRRRCRNGCTLPAFFSAASASPTAGAISVAGGLCSSSASTESKPSRRRLASAAAVTCSGEKSVARFASRWPTTALLADLALARSGFSSGLKGRISRIFREKRLPTLVTTKARSRRPASSLPISRSLSPWP